MVRERRRLVVAAVVAVVALFVGLTALLWNSLSGDGAPVASVADPPPEATAPLPPEATKVVEDEIAALRGSLQVAPLPIGWSRIPHDDAVFGDEGGEEMLSVVSGGPGLVAVGFLDGEDGAAAAVWTSVDGITWFRVPHDDAVFGGGVMRSVTVGGPGLVAVGQEGTGYTDEGRPGRRDAAVWTSVDGITWSRVPFDEELFGGPSNQSMASVTVGGPGLVAVGWDDTNAAVWTSVDGITWSRVPYDESVFGFVGRPSMVSITVGGPGLVAVGSDNSDAAVWTSIDGITWSRILDHQDVFGEPGLLRMSAVTATESSLVAVGFERPGGSSPVGFGEDIVETAAVWTSTDGVTWSRVPHNRAVGAPHDQEMLSVTAWGPGLVAVGQEGASFYRGYPSLHAAVWMTTP